jgi:hypothetical protein
MVTLLVMAMMAELVMVMVAVVMYLRLCMLGGLMVL